MYKMLRTADKKKEGVLRLFPPSKDNVFHPKQGTKYILSLCQGFREHVNKLQLSVTIVQVNNSTINQLSDLMHVDFYLLGALLVPWKYG